MSSYVITFVVLGVGILLLGGVLGVVVSHLRRFSGVQSATSAALSEELGALKARKAALTVAFRDRNARRRTDA